MTLIPLKQVVTINPSALAETSDPALSFDYIDIGAVGRGLLVDHPIETTFADAPSRARRIVHPGDTIVSTVRTYLRATWQIRKLERLTIVSTGFAVLRPGRAVDPRYLGWLIASDLLVDEVVARSTGVSYPAINPSELGTIPVPVPTREHQRAIADFLDAETTQIDRLFAAKSALVDNCRQRLRRRIADLTQSNRVAAINSARPVDGSAASGVRLSRCFRDVTYGLGEATSASGPVPVLGMANVSDDGTVVGEPSGYLDAVTASLLLAEGDLLFNRTNSLAKVGKVALFHASKTPTSYASYLVRLRASPIALPKYLNYLLNTDALLGLARSTALPSIGQANLNPSRYGELRVCLPSRSDQQAIVDELDAEVQTTTRVIERLIRQTALLTERRQALITAAVNGELDVPGAA